jgi:hypothetical protein
MRIIACPFLRLRGTNLDLKIATVTKLAATCGLFATKGQSRSESSTEGFDNPRLLP